MTMKMATVPPFDVDYAPTLPNLIADAAARHGDREFLVYGDRRLTFRDVERESALLARGLLAMGIGKGARIGLLMANDPDWVITYLAIGRIGALAVTLSTFFQASEISWGVRHNDLDTLLICKSYMNNDYIERLERGLPGLAGHTSPELLLPTHPFLRRIMVWGGCDRPWALQGPDALLEAARSKPGIDGAFLAAVEANVVPADWLLTICTSGTTAEPKAVVHTHGGALRAAKLFNHYFRFRGSDRIYSGQAFFWIGGHNMNLLPAMFEGASLHFTPTPKPEDIVDLILREKITALNLWLPQAEGVAAHAKRLGVTLDSVRRGLGPAREDNGNIVPPDRLSRSMGMTESFGPHSMEMQYVPSPAGKAGAWGRHLPGVTRLVIDPETGREVEPGEEGELYLRGHTLMVGYYKREREETFTEDGFFATGDLVSIDADDFIYFNSRRSEMIKTSGANVSPREVETLLQTFPEVREAVVFGVPDPLKGEIVVAVIVPIDGQEPDAEDLRARLRAEISPYKVPQQIIFMNFDDIPRTGSIKARKGDLAALLVTNGVIRGAAAEEDGS
jgi:acyl-coenzyme A synthetase/AMP-(fatty) acid ligase